LQKEEISAKIRSENLSKTYSQKKHIEAIKQKVRSDKEWSIGVDVRDAEVN